jgi:hypothetical protein
MIRCQQSTVSLRGGRDDRDLHPAAGAHPLVLDRAEQGVDGPGQDLGSGEISLGLRGGDSFTAISRKLGRAVSTVSREVACSDGRTGYRAWRAHQRA